MSVRKDLLTHVEKENPKLGVLLQSIIKSIETTARNAGVSSNGNIPPPAPPDSIEVSTTGELLQFKVHHSAPIQKGIQYITHISTDPQFHAPIIIDHGSSRSPAHIVLPTKNLAGDTHDFYIRSAAQYQGSDPSGWTYYGGQQPAKVNMGGLSQMDIMPGTGSGTGSTDGQQSAVGLGKAIYRPAPAPKRSVA